MPTKKRVFVIGGTGFLGYHAIQEFSNKGWGVTAIGLPPAHPSAPPFTHPSDSSAVATGQVLYPASVKIMLQNLNDTSDEELLTLLRGHEALVFAAGLDDRYTPKKPAYPKFHKANVESMTRLLTLAKKAGIKRAVVLGSYFVHFNRLWPELKLAERHPYIRSRLEQEKAATSIPGLDGMVLELPYVFGVLPFPGWKPLWTPLVKYLRSSKTIFFMKGGTACISARTAGRAIVAAVERGEAGKCYPIGQENMTWRQMLRRLAAVDGREVHVIALPTWLIKTGMYGLWFVHRLLGKEHGLDPRYFADLQTAETWLDPEPSRRLLGFELDDLDESFRDTVEACKG